MQKNDLFDIEITDIGVDGEGIGHYDGMTFFIKDAVIGDVIRARALKLKKNYGYARVEEVLTPSTFRVLPKCPIYRKCGGCQIQALAYEKQLAFKQEKVRGNLIRIGGFAPEMIDAIMLPPIGMDEPYRYRNKAQFPVGYDRDGNICFGFYAARSHSIIPVEDCMLGVESNKEILKIVKAWMEDFGIQPYDETTGEGLLRHVLIRYGFSTEEIMVCLVINGKKLPQKESLCERLRAVYGMTSISFNVNMENTNVILGSHTECIWGQPYITDYIHLYEGETMAAPMMEPATHAIAYQISPQSFYQVNPVQTEKLYGTALQFAQLTGKESVWDLYCGIGTISLFLSQRAKKVYGVEIVPQAIEDAKNNARINGITNVEFFVGKAEEVLPEFYEKANRAAKNGSAPRGLRVNTDVEDMADMLRPDVIVVDPPRKGCDEKCIETMLRMQPQRIVYVSCDSATLARDLRILCDGGYELQKVQAVDQFCHTVHVETVCLLSKLNAKQHIEINLDMDELDLTDAEKKATYQEIKDYVLEHSGLKVSSLYIAQVKQKCGIIERENYNKPKSEDAKQPQCPPDKEKAIKEALTHFGMI